MRKDLLFDLLFFEGRAYTYKQDGCDFMTKNLILFGAGASFGSDKSGTPPLGNNLFLELAQFNPPGWGSLPDEFRNAFNNDFEQGVLKVASERPHDLPILQRAMSAFFFNFKPQNSNLYFKLANKLKQSPKQLTVSTLNYERLFEISFCAAGYNLMIGQANSNEIELNLPHGCCHLFCESVKGVAGAVNFAGLNVEINGEIKIISDPQQFNQRITNDAFPPVMSYFEPQKRATAGQAFLTEQRTRFNDLVNTAKRIIVIGVKIREHDTHIWETIKNANGKLIYCSGLSEKNTFEVWTNTHRRNKENKFLDGFWSDKFDEVFNELI